MVRVRGPSLSQAAAGGLAETLIFSESKGRQYVKRWAAPRNPDTHSQRAVRAIQAFLTKVWASLSPAHIATWLPLAEVSNIPPYNAFLAYNLTRWRSHLRPARTYPATETGTNCSYGTKLSQSVGRRVQLRVEFPPIQDTWGSPIYQPATYAATVTWSKLIHIWQLTGSGWQTFLSKPYAPGTYHFSFSWFTTSGKPAAQSNFPSITIT